MKNEYAFYGHENADKVTAKSKDFPFVKNPIDLYAALTDIWCAETCAPRMRAEWSESNITKGQCSITAFLAQDIFGGEVYGTYSKAGDLHLYNAVNGIIFDLTSEQFGAEAASLVYDKSNPQERSAAIHFGKEEKKQRYEYLKNELLKQQRKQNESQI